MQKRTYERMNTNVRVSFFYRNDFYHGTMTNCSENGMCIKTRMCFPFETRIELLIPSKEDVLKVLVEVKRLEKTEGFYDAMGVELLNSSPKYLEFIKSLNPD
jgi:hypothetical protein